MNGLRDERRKREAWAAAKRFWGGLRMTRIDCHISAAYITERERAPNTLRNELGAIRTALRWAVGESIIPAAPVIVLSAMPESEVQHLSKAQFRRFLAGGSAPHVKLFAQLAVTTRGRATALLELPWVRVDLERRLINLNPAGGIQRESKRRAAVPINARLLPVLTEAKTGALTPLVIETGGERIKSIKKGIAAAAERSGVHCTPHVPSFGGCLDG